MGPPANPFSLPHSSCRYCDNGLGAAPAVPWIERQTDAKAAMTSRNKGRYECQLRNVFKPLNNYLGLLFERNPGASEDIKIHVNSFVPGCWDSGSKGVFRDKLRFCSSLTLGRAERKALGPPANGICDATGWGQEARDVCWNVVRLNYKLRIPAGRITPACDFDPKLPVVLFGRSVVPRKHAQHGRRFQE